jgi:hypothetical protein
MVTTVQPAGLVLGDDPGVVPDGEAAALADGDAWAWQAQSRTVAVTRRADTCRRLVIAPRSASA